MSNDLRFEFALQEPAMAIAPVFTALQKGPRKKLDVTFHFGGSKLQWRGPDALGIVEQSVLLGLLSIAKQRTYWLSPSSPSITGKLLLTRLRIISADFDCDFAVLKASWKKLAAAAGYKSSGGKNVAIVKSAVKRLAETVIWEERNGRECQSGILSFVEGDKDGVTIALNRRATDALCGGQYVKISLSERHALSDDSTKALHAWLSGQLRHRATRVYTIRDLQKHVWGGEVTGSTLRSRIAKLRAALNSIGQLPAWICHFPSSSKVEITREVLGTIDDKPGDYRRAPGTIDNSRKSA